MTSNQSERIENRTGGENAGKETLEERGGTRIRSQRSAYLSAGWGKTFLLHVPGGIPIERGRAKERYSACSRGRCRLARIARRQEDFLENTTLATLKALTGESARRGKRQQDATLASRRGGGPSSGGSAAKGYKTTASLGEGEAGLLRERGAILRHSSRRKLERLLGDSDGVLRVSTRRLHTKRGGSARNGGGRRLLGRRRKPTESPTCVGG